MRNPFEVIRDARLQDEKRIAAEEVGRQLAETGWPSTRMSIPQEVSEQLDQLLIDGAVESRFGFDVQSGYMSNAEHRIYWNVR